MDRRFPNYQAGTPRPALFSGIPCPKAPVGTCAGPPRRGTAIGRPDHERPHLAAALGCRLAPPVEAGERPHPIDINFFSEYAVTQVANALV